MLLSWARRRPRCATPLALADLDGLVIPGGESTTIMKGIDLAGLEPAIRAHHDGGRPVFGNRAGMIVCDDRHLGLDRRDRPP